MSAAAVLDSTNLQMAASKVGDRRRTVTSWLLHHRRRRPEPLCIRDLAAGHTAHHDTQVQSLIVDLEVGVVVVRILWGCFHSLEHPLRGPWIMRFLIRDNPGAKEWVAAHTAGCTDLLRHHHHNLIHTITVLRSTAVDRVAYTDNPLRQQTPRQVPSRTMWISVSQEHGQVAHLMVCRTAICPLQRDQPIEVPSVNGAWKQYQNRKLSSEIRRTKMKATRRSRPSSVPP